MKKSLHIIMTVLLGLLLSGCTQLNEVEMKEEAVIDVGEVSSETADFKLEEMQSLEDFTQYMDEKETVYVGREDNSDLADNYRLLVDYYIDEHENIYFATLYNGKADSLPDSLMITMMGPEEEIKRVMETHMVKGRLYVAQYWDEISLGVETLLDDIVFLKEELGGNTTSLTLPELQDIDLEGYAMLTVETFASYQIENLITF